MLPRQKQQKTVSAMRDVRVGGWKPIRYLGGNRPQRGQINPYEFVAKIGSWRLEVERGSWLRFAGHYNWQWEVEFCDVEHRRDGGLGEVGWPHTFGTATTFRDAKRQAVRAMNRLRRAARGEMMR